MNDERFMRMALRMAQKGLGRTSPNPCVGAVLVSGGKVVGRGFHAKAGADHAEIAALKDAGCKAKGATLYVTLEPCCHHGRTPPCTDALIKAGVKRVVSAMKDVSGGGLRVLRKAGIEVECGIFEDRARFLNQPYLKTTSIPYVALKTACTLDFKIAGKRKWITCPRSRKFARKLRSNYDAILTGVGTVLADNPMLSAKNRPLRIILDSRMRTPLSARVLRNKNVLLVTTGQRTLKDFDVLDMGKRIDVKRLLRKLKQRGIQSIFVEAGNAVNTSFVKSGVVDKFYVFVAPEIFGSGLSAFDAPLPKFKKIKTKKLGCDILFEGYVNLY